jgi:hypothetical protein
MIVATAFVLFMTPGTFIFLWWHGEFQKCYLHHVAKFYCTWRD